MIEILYQDHDFVVVHKPAGLLVHRSFKSSDKIFLLQTLRNQIGQQLFPVHRLDRPTSGVIAFALNQEAARNLSEQIQNHQVKKTYWAVVRGYTDESGRIDYAMAPEKGKDLQDAITDYRLLATAEFNIPCRGYSTSRYSLLQCSPLTGRYHQIRKHCAHISHHIVGDTKHGTGEHNKIYRENFNLNRLMLIAKRLEFFHFRLNKNIIIETTLDSDFADFLKRKEWNPPINHATK